MFFLWTIWYKTVKRIPFMLLVYLKQQYPDITQFFIENVWTQFHLSIFVLIPIIFTPSQQLNRLPRWIEWFSNRKYACMAKIRDCGTRYPRNDSSIKYANSRRIRYSKLPLCHWGKGEWGRAPYLFKSVIRCETVYDSVRWFLRSIFTGICLSGMATGDDNRLKSFLLSERNEFRGKLLMSFAQEFGIWWFLPFMLYIVCSKTNEQRANF